MSTEYATSDGEKEKEKDRLADDPPIIVGGGGSTWIWIKKQANIQFFDPANIPNTVEAPDPAVKPENPSLYYLLHLGNVTVTATRFRDGDQGNGNANGNVPNNNNGKKKHRTYFDGQIA